MGTARRFPRGTIETNLAQKSHPGPQIDDISALLGCDPSACVEGRPLCWNGASSLRALNIQPGAACCSACWAPPCGHRGSEPPANTRHLPATSPRSSTRGRSRKASSKKNRAVASSHSRSQSSHRHLSHLLLIDAQPPSRVMTDTGDSAEP